MGIYWTVSCTIAPWVSMQFVPDPYTEIAIFDCSKQTINTEPFTVVESFIMERLILEWEIIEKVLGTGLHHHITEI